jgi:nicotinate-nucleotide pyrophosphorylase (carboxylating)
MSIAPMARLLVEPVVRAALLEDLGRAGDVTSAACVPANATLNVAFVFRATGVIAGLQCAKLAAELVDPTLIWTTDHDDGASVAAGTTIATLSGNARSILAAERVALNFLGRLSGIATLTRAYVDAIKGTKARIVCTRKTTPGLRALEKHAVRLGGGSSHRYGLDDAVLIKDNHIAAAGGVSAALRAAQAYAGHLLSIEVEVDSLPQLEEALPFKPNVIMLDNFSLEALRVAVARVASSVVLEASGGINLNTVRAVAETGVDVISVGALTHSAPNLDVGLDVALPAR